MTSKNTPSHGGCCQGLTIIELLVVVSIAAILATLATPFLRDFVVRNKLAGLSNEFTASVLRARNEAVTARRTGSMASDRCGDMSIDHYGRKHVTGFDTSRFASEDIAIRKCWS